ncbi:MAG: hypothetical protein FJ033_06730 [Chloroflexi bacterium]|nr:hypothetical protein [Chloroflexota bacterium]
MLARKIVRLGAAAGLVLSLGIAGSLTGASAREAAAIPGTFRSSIVVANPGTTTANVTMSFVKADGTQAITPLAFTVASNSSVNRYVPGIAGLADGRYSVVIDSDQAVVAIANLTSDNPTTSTAYNGIAQSEVGTSFNMPAAYKNYYGFSSSYVIQNAGSATANVTITYRTSSGVVTTETRQIASNASVTVDQSLTSGLPDGFGGSATISSDQSVAAIFLVSASGQLSSARGARTGATTVNLPSVYNQYAGYNSAVTVQNIGSASTNVRVEYFSSTTGASLGTESKSVAAGASAIFLQFDGTDRTAILRPGQAGSAVVTSVPENVIAFTNIQYPAQNYLESYNGFLTSSATTRVSCAAIMNNYYNYNTALTVMNVGSAATNLTIHFINSSGTVVSTQNVTNLQPNSSHVRWNPNDGIPVGFLGAAVVTSSGSPIIAIVNELYGTGSESGDQLFAYACANN